MLAVLPHKIAGNDFDVGKFTKDDSELTSILKNRLKTFYEELKIIIFSFHAGTFS